MKNSLIPVLHFRADRLVLLALAVVLLGGCGSKAINRAPVEDRGTPLATRPVPLPPPQPSFAASVVVKPVPDTENVGKVGYYVVKPGDTLIRIGLEHGQSARDIARWNGIENPNRIEVGQVLRVEPPLVSSRAAARSSVSTRPAAPLSTATPVSAPHAPAGTQAVAAGSAVSAASPVIAAAEDDLRWIWPVNGVVLVGFDEQKNKGLDIGGVAGEPVLAAADGRVVYAGAGLRGYGNLIILKHNNVYLTAYAHNKTLLIKEDQTVRQGQKIAEMGNSDADRVKLHFEVRKQGKPVDPAKYLPTRPGIGG